MAVSSRSSVFFLPLGIIQVPTLVIKVVSERNCLTQSLKTAWSTTQSLVFILTPLPRLVHFPLFCFFQHNRTSPSSGFYPPQSFLFSLIVSLSGSRFLTDMRIIQDVQFSPTMTTKLRKTFSVEDKNGRP